MQQLRRRLATQFPWMSVRHPMAQREISRVSVIPLFFRRLTEIRSMLGYAALIHLTFFAASMIIYNRKQLLLNAILAPFLTPFGLPLAAAALHSILYWAMLIGVCNMFTTVLCRDLMGHTWQLLRLTPVSSTHIMLAKMTAVRHVWQPILIALMVMRMLAGLSVPLTSALEGHHANNIDFIMLALFVIEPLIDGFLAVSLSALSATLVPNVLGSRLLAYGLLGIVLGLIGLINTLWLLFTSVMGTLAGLLTPLSHWSMLAVALAPNRHPETAGLQLAVMALLHVIIPLIVALITFKLAVRIANQRM